MKSNTSTTTDSAFCPYMIYGSQWRRYLYLPESKNHYSTSPLDSLANNHIPLFNQTEWIFKFEEQSNPLSCPSLYSQEGMEGPYLAVDREEDTMYQYGNRIYTCDEVDFKDNLALVCDRLLCFSPEERRKLFNPERKFGINLTSLIPDTLKEIVEDEFFTKRLILFYLSKYIGSISTMNAIPINDFMVSDYHNELLNTLLPQLNHNFTFGFELVEIFTACRYCRDYTKEKVIEQRDVCMAVDYPFNCESGSDLEGVPSSAVAMVHKYSFDGSQAVFLSGYSQCFCPDRATSITERENDVYFNNDTAAVIRIASKCDYYNVFWYPIFQQSILRQFYLGFEVLLFFIVTLLVFIPLIVQSVTEIVQKLCKNTMEIPKLHKALRKKGPKRINKILRKGVYFYKNTASNATGKSWLRIVFNIRLISAVTLVIGITCFLMENIFFLMDGFSIDSIRLILNGYAGYYTSVLFVLALWIDTMIRVEKNTHSISLIIVIPLFTLLSVILVSSIVLISLEFTIGIFLGIIIFYTCMTVMFVLIMILLVVYGAKIFVRLKVPLFQLKITRFLILLLSFGIPTVSFMTFFLVQRLALSQIGFYISTRFFTLFLHDVISICFTGLGFCISYGIYPSNKVVLESYNTIIYLFLSMICVGKKIKRYLKEKELTILHQVFVANSFHSIEQSPIISPTRTPATYDLTPEDNQINYTRLE